MATYPQAGITNRPPEHLILATFRLVHEDAEAARGSLRALSEVVERELRSDLDRANPPEAKEAPSEETGELGFEDDYDRAHLTITFGISSSVFERLGIVEEDRPQDLRPIPWEQLGQTPTIRTRVTWSCRFAPTTSTSASTSPVASRRSWATNSPLSPPRLAPSAITAGPAVPPNVRAA